MTDAAADDPEAEVITPGVEALRAAARRLNYSLPALVAATALWAPPEQHRRRVTPANPTGAVYPNKRRARRNRGERQCEVKDGVYLDNNTYAHAAIFRALGVRKPAVLGFQACHIWPGTCYDVRYHTCLANLVMVPRPIGSLTDHDPDVVAALQFRAFELFQWHPVEVAAPTRPASYPAAWCVPGRVPA